MEKNTRQNGKQATENYHRTQMQKEIVLQRLREQGCRITRQRQILLDIILQEECGSCKEIYYKAIRQDDGIGAATVYRMVNLLEEIGAISRRNMYKISCEMECDKANVCTIELDDCSTCQLSAKNWHKVISEGMKVCGYRKDQKVISVMMDSCAKEC